MIWSAHGSNQQGSYVELLRFQKKENNVKVKSQDGLQKQVVLLTKMSASGTKQIIIVIRFGFCIGFYTCKFIVFKILCLKLVSCLF